MVEWPRPAAPQPTQRNVHLLNRDVTIKRRRVYRQQLQVSAPSPVVVPRYAKGQQGRVVSRAQSRRGRRLPLRGKPLADVDFRQRVQVLRGAERSFYRHVEFVSNMECTYQQVE